MRKRVTIPLLIALCLLAVGPIWAQPMEVTVRELNALPGGNVDVLNAIGEDTDGLIPSLIQPELMGETLVVTVVVLSDPLNSGLASWVSDRGGPGRIHIFARDTSAVTQGFEGMGVQIVDGNYEDTGSLNLLIGDVIRVTGEISFFGTAMQLTATTIEPLGSYTDHGLPDSILDPVVVTTADLNMMVGEQQNQANWSNYESLIHQYVRIEDATILRRTLAPNGRPNWNLSTDGGDTFTQNDDLSLRYRNDRAGSYTSPPFNVRDSNDPFEPPPVGSHVNVEGYVVFRGAFEAFDFVGVPSGAFMQIAPFADDDLEVIGLPNVRSVAVNDLTEVPGDAPVPVSVDIDADAGVLASVTASWTNLTTGATGMVDLADQGDGTYAGELPAQGDGDFVSFSVVAENTDGITFSSEPAEVMYRVLFDGINEIADIQLTADGGEGSSPFDGITTAMNVTGTVQNDPATSGFIVIQDDAGLGGWSGILIDGTDELIADLQRGDLINITSALIEENFDVTQLSDIEYTTVTEGGDPIGYKDVTTDVLQDEAIAEAHEGMMLRFEDVYITEPDAGFGEWAFSTDGTDDNAVLADDASDALSSDFNTRFGPWEQVDYIQGIWWFSFGDFKLLPEAEGDVGAVINVAIEDTAVPGSFALEQNYPNPFNPVTTLEYALPATARVRLEVVDMLGRTVSVLVDGEQAPGTYSVRFDASNLASGLYLYRLTAGNRVETKKMMLLK